MVMFQTPLINPVHPTYPLKVEVDTKALPFQARSSLPVPHTKSGPQSRRRTCSVVACRAVPWRRAVIGLKCGLEASGDVITLVGDGALSTTSIRAVFMAAAAGLTV